MKLLKKIVYSTGVKVFNILLPKKFYFSHKGYCPCCDKYVSFISFNSWLRDYFICMHCESIPRERALMLTIEKYYPNWRDLTIHESSPCNHGASIKLKNQCKKYISSHFYQDKHIGINVNGHLNEDLENQTFKDESFDLIITQDVMEHVYDPAHAFSEIARTLKNGGEHILTVPLVNKHKPTEVWAVKGKDSKPIFLKKPEYHVIQLTQTVPR